MNYENILRRAFDITKNYRALWLFGVVMALTGAGGSVQMGNNFGGGGGHGGGMPQPFGRFLPHVPEEMLTLLIVVGVSLLCVIVILAVAAAVARYVSRTSLLLMVDEYEQDGTVHTWKEGLRLGWSPSAYRLFLMELAISLPVGLVITVGIIVALLPLLGWATNSRAFGIVGTTLSLVLLVPVFLAAIIASVLIAIFLPIARRVCVLEGLGVGESIGAGIRFIREHLRDVAVMWMVMLGVNIVWTIGLLLVALILSVVGAVVGGIPALVVGVLASLFTKGVTPWVLAGLVGIPLFAVVVAVPMLFLQGLVEVFKSSAWTLAYREMRSAEVG